MMALWLTVDSYGAHRVMHESGRLSVVRDSWGWVKIKSMNVCLLAVVRKVMGIWIVGGGGGL